MLEAHDIPKMDQMGKSDPSVTLFTDPKHKVSTKTVKNTLTPKWESDNEFFLMVQVQLTWLCVSLQRIWRSGTRRCMRHVVREACVVPEWAMWCASASGWLSSLVLHRVSPHCKDCQ